MLANPFYKNYLYKNLKMSRSHTEISEEKKAPRWEYLYKLVNLIQIYLKISL